MKIVDLPIAGAFLVDLDRHADDRGSFAELYRQEWFNEVNFNAVQASRTDKCVGSLVGLHFHLQQTDYWHVAAGHARVVLHDLRDGSLTEGVTWSECLDGNVPRGLFIPPGVAHGFAALTDLMMIYLLDRPYDPSDEKGVAWNDPEIDADWRVKEPILSERDRVNPRRADLVQRPSWKR